MDGFLRVYECVIRRSLSIKVSSIEKVYSRISVRTRVSNKIILLFSNVANSVLNYVTLLSLNSIFDDATDIRMDFYYRRIIRRFPKNITKNDAEIPKMENVSLLQVE